MVAALREHARVDARDVVDACGVCAHAHSDVHADARADDAAVACALYVPSYRH